MKLKKKSEYLAPQTEVVIVKLENGILTTSGNIEDSIENPTVGW